MIGLARTTGCRVALLIAGACAALVAATTAADQPLTTPQVRLLQQVALGKARTALLDEVRRLPISVQKTVGDWLAQDADLDRAVRLWVRAQPRHGQPRLYSDGVCEADVLVMPDGLRDRLLALLDEYGPAAQASQVDAASLRASAGRWPVLWATGRSQLRDHQRSDHEPGWANVTSEGMLLARRAAEADAYQALLDEAGRLKVTQARRLREFLQSGNTVRDAVRDAIRRAATARVEFAPDQVAVAQVSLDIRVLLRILTQVHAEHYAGDAFAAADFREMALLAGRGAISAQGLAPPPERTILRNRYEPIEYNAPDWAAQTLRAGGRFVPPEDEAVPSDAALTAARLSAADAMREKVEALVIQQSVTVSDFVGYHQALKEDVTRFLTGVRLTGRPRELADGGVLVEVELPLRRLWELVRQHMKLEEVDPPEKETQEAP